MLNSQSQAATACLAIGKKTVDYATSCFGLIKLSILLAFLINAAPLVSDVNEPKSPKEPKVIRNTKLKNKKPINENLKNKAFNKSSESKKNSLKVIITFENRVNLTGKVTFPKESIFIQSKKKGFIFTKEIKWHNVEKIEILMWKPEKKNSKEFSKKMVLYYFYPYKYKITLTTGKIYVYEGNIKYLNKLTIVNQFGKANIFSYFADYWKFENSNSGIWLNLKKEKFNFQVISPLGKNFKIIEFIDKK